MTRQLSTLIGAGVPLRDSLEVLTKSASDENERAVLVWLVKAVENGFQLSEAMDAHPQVFDRVYVSMVGVGEETGHLSRTLESLATWLDSEQRLVRHVKASMTYPALVMVMAICLTLFYLVAIFPGFAEFLGEGSDVPLPTRVLMILSATLSNPLTWLLGIALLGLGAKILSALFRTMFYRRLVWNILKKIPLVSTAIRNLTCSRFCSAMSIMMDSGVDILTAFRLSSLASGSPLIANNIVVAVDSVNKGGNLSDHMTLHPESYPAMMVGLVATGEEAAKLPLVFEHLAHLLDEEAHHSFEILTAALEPIVMMLVSLLVGGLIVCTAMPIYALIRDTL